MELKKGWGQSLPSTETSVSIATVDRSEIGGGFGIKQRRGVTTFNMHRNLYYSRRWLHIEVTWGKRIWYATEGE
jgi:hypothetical protein